MPSRHSPHVTPSSSLEDTPETRAMKVMLQKRIQEGMKRRADESRQKQQEEAERREEEEARKALERGEISNYISVIIIALLFTALPLSERTIDWIQVGLVVATNTIYALAFHRHTWLHYVTFVMINLLVVQWGPFIYAVPELLAAIPAIYYVLFTICNATLVIVPYAVVIRPEPSAKRRETLWDYVATGVLLANFVGLVATGIIPPRLIFKALRAMLNLATRYSIDTE